MSHYKMSPGQKHYLKRRAIAEKRNARCCDCRGCDTCTGFVTGCTCDEEPIHDILERIRGHRERGTDS